MFKYSTFNRYKRFFKRVVFKVFFSHSFKKFGKKVVIFEPDIIEGEEYISIGDYASLGTKCWILALKRENLIPNIYIDNGTTIGRFAHIVAIDQIVIEKNVLIADKVYISDNKHVYQDILVPIKNQDIKVIGKVFIGENSWIGENVSILGAKIGKHCIIGANSMVNSDIPDFSIAVGSPARVIKQYNLKSKVWESI